MEQWAFSLGGHLEIVASPDTRGWMVTLTIDAPCRTSDG